MATSKPTQAQKVTRWIFLALILLLDVAMGYFTHYVIWSVIAAAFTLLLFSILRFYRSRSFLES